MALEQPKKPVGGAFGNFLTEKRPEFMKALAGKPISQVTVMASEEWKKLSEAQKAPFQKKYEAAKAKFDKDMAAFLAAGGEKTKGVTAQRKANREAKEGKKAKKNKDPNAPKKPAGGSYGVFLAENRAKITAGLPANQKAMTDVAKAAGAQFKLLSEDAKKKYEAAYQKKKADYEKALKEYKASHPDAADEDEDDEEEEEEEGSPAKEAPQKAASKKAAAPKEAPAQKRAAAKKAEPEKKAKVARLGA